MREKFVQISYENKDSLFILYRRAKKLWEILFLHSVSLALREEDRGECPLTGLNRKFFILQTEITCRLWKEKDTGARIRICTPESFFPVWSIPDRESLLFGFLSFGRQTL